MDGFVDIKGYEGLYKINILGDIMRKEKLLKPFINTHGYKRITLCKNGKKKYYLIHRLIGIHFIPNPENLPCIDHINRDKKDNRIENLRWYSQRDNIINSEYVDKRKGYIGEITYKSKKTGKITTYYQFKYNLLGQHSDKYKKSKCFKTLEELEAFQLQIYNF